MHVVVTTVNLSVDRDCPIAPFPWLHVSDKIDNMCVVLVDCVVCFDFVVFLLIVDME